MPVNRQMTNRTDGRGLPVSNRLSLSNIQSPWLRRDPNRPPFQASPAPAGRKRVDPALDGGQGRGRTERFRRRYAYRRAVVLFLPLGWERDNAMPGLARRLRDA